MLSSDTMMLNIANQSQALSRRIFLLSAYYISNKEESKRMCIEKSLDLELALLQSSNQALLCAQKNAIITDKDSRIKSLYVHDTISNVDRYIASGQNLLNPDNLDKVQELNAMLLQIYDGLQNDIIESNKFYELEAKNTQTLVNNTERLLAIIIWLIVITTAMKYAFESKTKEKKILVVEDNMMTVNIIRKIIENLGYKIVVANNGQEAIDILNIGRNFILIFMDREMPIMGGIEATATIRKIEAEQGATRIPIIALTASLMEDDKKRYISCGMDDYLPKPIKVQDIKRTILNWDKGQDE